MWRRLEIEGNFITVSTATRSHFPSWVNTILYVEYNTDLSKISQFIPSKKGINTEKRVGRITAEASFGKGKKKRMMT